MAYSLAPVFTEAQHSFDGLLEAHHQLSIDEVIIAQNQTILVGAPLGAIAVTGDVTVAGAAASGNTGTATIGSISATSQSQNGVYNIVLLSTGTTAEFEVQRPDGTVDGTGKIGAPYTGTIDFTISSGGTPTVGDQFTVSVTAPFDEGGFEFETWAPGATDGSQNAIAIALQTAVTGAGQTAKIAALRRDGAFRASAMNWGGASFFGAISSTTLTVVEMMQGSGPIALGATLSGGGVTGGTTIAAFGTGTGGVGAYTLSASQSVEIEAMNTAPPTASQIAYATEQLAAKNIVLR